MYQRYVRDCAGSVNADSLNHAILCVVLRRTGGVESLLVNVARGEEGIGVSVILNSW